MNDSKITFIICYNEEAYLSECIAYIEELYLPAGFEMDYLTIEGADSIAEGYNTGMNASDAKYKIYLHQDVFILNRNLLNDLLAIFKSDLSIGLVGLTGGYEKIAGDAIRWNAGEACGKNYDASNQEERDNHAEKYFYDVNMDGYRQVAVVDGCFMATSVDVEWDEAVISGWSFYEMYHCIAMIQAGFKVVVPQQRLPWILHDSIGPINSGYNKGRRQFIAEYYHLLNQHYSIIEKTESGKYVSVTGETVSLSGSLFDCWNYVRKKADLALKKGEYLTCSGASFDLTAIEQLREDAGFTNTASGATKEEAVEPFEDAEIAICVPTYNHAELLKQVLPLCIELYRSMKLDVYYYDSSDNSDTKELIEAYQKQGFDNLHYIFFETSPDGYGYEKMLRIFEKYGLEKNYQYVWPVKDRVVFSIEALRAVKRHLKSRPDFLFLGSTEIEMGTENFKGIQYLNYSKPEEFYRDWGWLSTSMDVSIYNANTLLKDFQEEELTFKAEREAVCAWSQIVVMYNRLHELDRARIIVITEESTGPYNIKGGASGWFDRILRVLKGWVKANKGLPERYQKYADEVIRQFACLPWILGGKPRIMQLIQQGYISREKYLEVRDIWQLISDVPTEMMDSILLNKTGGETDVTTI